MTEQGINNLIAEASQPVATQPATATPALADETVPDVAPEKSGRPTVDVDGDGVPDITAAADDKARAYESQLTFGTDPKTNEPLTKKQRDWLKGRIAELRYVSKRK